MPDPWQAPPPRPRLADGELHVWRAALQAAPNDAHGILRALLGRYLGAEPGSLELARGAHGKPELSGGAALRFNLSHSGRLALYAFALGAEVGVDLELAGRRRDEAALAARVFGLAEAERLRVLEPAVREREFLGAWVRHEAMLKCRGTGFAGAAASGAEDVGGLWLAELDVGPRAAAAVAWGRAAAPTRVVLWDRDRDRGRDRGEAS